MTTEQLIEILKQYPDHLVRIHIDTGEESNKVCIGNLEIARPKDNWKPRPFLWISNDEYAIDHTNHDHHYKIIEVNEE